MLSLDGSGQFALSDALLLYSQKEISFFLNNGSRRCVLNCEIYFPQKSVFRGFLSSGNLIVEWSGAGL